MNIGTQTFLAVPHISCSQGMDDQVIDITTIFIGLVMEGVVLYGTSVVIVRLTSRSGDGVSRVLAVG